MRSVFRRAREWAGRKEKLVLLAIATVILGTMAFFAVGREVLNGRTQAFDEWAVESLRNPDIHINCAQGEWTPGWLYVYEVHCFDTQEEVTAYMGLQP